MRRSISLVLAIVVLTVTAACVSAEEREAELNAVNQQQRASGDRQPRVMSEDDLRVESCVRRSGVDSSLEAIGNDGEARTELYRALIECEPDLETVDLVVIGLVDSLNLVFDNLTDITRGEGRCLIRHILDTSPDPARTLSVFDEEGQQILFDGYDQCFSDDDLAIIYGTAGPMAYGDNDRLDRMYDDCLAGDPTQCDVLFFNAAEGSDYHALAYECAGEGAATPTSCSAEGEVDPDTGYADLASPGLDLLAAACDGGDLPSCDLLAFIAPPGDTRRDIGETCGGRILVAAIPDCQTSIGQ